MVKHHPKDVKDAIRDPKTKNRYLRGQRFLCCVNIGLIFFNLFKINILNIIM